MATKVFVGNLSFQTKQDKLQEEFSAAGRVLSANIISRGPRSLGYGFVELASEADAENAVKLLNQKEIDGRQINVEIARARPEGEEAPAPRERKPRRRPPTNGDASGGEEGSSSNGAPRERRPRRQGPAGEGGAPRPRRTYREKRTDAGAEGASPSEGSSTTTTTSTGRSFNQARGQGFRRRRNTRGEGQQGAAGAPPAANAGAPRSPGQGRFAARQRRPRHQSQERIPSENTLFVANLPFSVTDAELAEIFSAHSVTKAHVVVKRNGKSKGFGFVEFATKENQAAALKDNDGRDYKGRPLNVKIALQSPPGSEEGEEKAETSEKKEGEASSSGASSSSSSSTPTTAAAPANAAETKTEEAKTSA